MAEPIVGKISIIDFNRMQGLVTVVDGAAYGDNAGRVDEGDAFYARKAFDQYQQDDRIPFSDARIKAFREDPDAYRTIRRTDKAAMDALAKEYGLVIGEPKAQTRCGCDLGIYVDSYHLRDVHIDSEDGNTMNLAVVKYELTRIANALKVDVSLPGDVAVRMVQFGVSYNSVSARLSFRPELERDQSFLDIEHPTKSVVFELASEADCMLITVSDDQGTKKYKVYLGFGTIQEVK